MAKTLPRHPYVDLSLPLLVMLIISGTALAQQPNSGIPVPVGDAVQQGYSAHGQQWEELKLSRVKVEPEILQAQQREIQLRAVGAAPAILAATPTVDPDFIIFGYHPSYRDGLEYHYRWHALTHIGYSFVDFDAAGVISTSGWDTRPLAFRAGGAAEANGVKVVIVLRNQGFSEAVLDTVMQSPALRTTLVNNVVAEVNSDSYCAGVNLDLEFNWGTATRDGITAFCTALNTALKALSPPRELSMYVNPTYSSTRHDVAGLEPHLDYMLLSCYPWAGTWSGAVRAISDADNFVASGNNYLNAGLPARKLVLAISAYGHRWRTTTIDYSAVITSSIGSMGFTDGLYDVTLQPDYGGPYARNYMRTDETPWYGYNDGSNRTHVYDDQESMELKLRLAKSWRDGAGSNNGARLRGVGFWELGWMAEENSYDPITSVAVSRTRTYGQIYQLCEEIFSPPGDVNFLFEKFEGPDSQRDYRWRDPNESPDTSGDTDSNSSCQLALAPAGVGSPPDTENAMQVVFDFESASGNLLFFRHEILNDSSDIAVTDTNSAKAYVDTTSKFRVYLHVGDSGYAGREVRMVLMDADDELERSAPYSLAGPGWQLLEWDLTDAAQINAYTTAEPAFSNGDGVLDSAGGGTRDIAFIGFLISGGASGSGTLYFDELSYTSANPGGLDYVINEFRYSNPDQEFVEIYGPAGALPAGFQLRFVDSSDGSVTAVGVTGTVSDDTGGGYGFFVVGDPGVPNVDFSTGFAAGVNDIPDIDPGGLQLYNSAAGGVYDSVVYEAFGGLDDLVRQQTLGVTQNGYPWLGEVGPGADISGRTYTMGRYPDGGNTFVNFDDFSFMPASPGVLNGTSIVFPFTTDFGAEPPRAFQTYQDFSVVNPPGAGLPPSPSGGNAYRCVDTTGGGVIGVIGDAALGADGEGYSATAEIYIPAATEAAQAIAAGLCGRQGSTFFTTLGIARSGYESGYWLIYENAAGVALNDGRPDHAGVFEFVYATHDNMDDSPVLLLGSASLAITGASEGAWTTLHLTISPTAAAGNRLVASINGVDVYRGDIPSGGPISGAFQVGFRENHAGGPLGGEGTWIDNLRITPAIVTSIVDWRLY